MRMLSLFASLLIITAVLPPAHAQETASPELTLIESLIALQGRASEGRARIETEVRSLLEQYDREAPVEGRETRYRAALQELGLTDAVELAGESFDPGSMTFRAPGGHEFSQGIICAVTEVGIVSFMVGVFILAAGYQPPARNVGIAMSLGGTVMMLLDAIISGGNINC